MIEPQQSSTSAPNRIRDTSAVGPNAELGTLEIRRRFVNQTGAPITQLRFRVVDVTTLGTPNPGGAQADLRWLNSENISVTTSRGMLTVRGRLVDAPAQPLGGGLHSSGQVVSIGQLAPGAAIDVRFVLGVHEGGRFRFLINVDAGAGPALP